MQARLLGFIVVATLLLVGTCTAADDDTSNQDDDTIKAALRGMSNELKALAARVTGNDGTTELNQFTDRAKVAKANAKVKKDAAVAGANNKAAAMKAAGSAKAAAASIAAKAKAGELQAAGAAGVADANARAAAASNAAKAKAGELQDAVQKRGGEVRAVGNAIVTDVRAGGATAVYTACISEAGTGDAGTSAVRKEQCTKSSASPVVVADRADENEFSKSVKTVTTPGGPVAASPALDENPNSGSVSKKEVTMIVTPVDEKETEPTDSLLPGIAVVTGGSSPDPNAPVVSMDELATDLGEAQPKNLDMVVQLMDEKLRSEQIGDSTLEDLSEKAIDLVGEEDPAIKASSITSGTPVLSQAKTVENRRKDDAAPEIAPTVSPKVDAVSK